ncbi:Putative multidrug export ATP-binding/permease protein [Phycisphaerales bacterium]|nr:Putative multidrug export ATP-binding/permease protein [Phycisphaerales bacterium]
MLPQRRGSRERFRDYQRARKADAAWAARAADEKGPRADKNKRSRSFFDLFARFWDLTVGHRPYVYLALTTLTIVTAVSLVLPASTKIAIDYILTSNPGPEGIPAGVRSALRLPSEPVPLLWYLGTFVVSAALLGVTLGTVGRWQMTRITKRLQAHLRRITFDHAVHLPLHRIHHYKSGGMASMLREDAGLAGELLFTMIYNPWRAVVQLFGTLVILTFVDWRMLAGGLMLIPVVWVTHRTWIGRIRPLYRDAKLVRQGIDATTTEAFGGMRVVRGFSRERAESTRFTAAQHYMTRIEVLTWWWSRILEVAWAVLIPAASAAVLIYGGTQVLRGNLTIGDVMMFSTYLLMLLGPMETLTSTAANIQSNLAALDRVLDLLGEEKEFAGSRGDAVVARVASEGRVELRDVWFTYPRAPRKPGANAAQAPTEPSPEPVIRGVSLSVEPGEIIAFVGPSGSGKTTLCNLIARFYDPTAGSILFDGVDLKKIDVASYRSLLGIVEQDVFLFDGTVAQNIAYGRRDARPEEIINAAKAANSHAFITELEKGYETIIGERGVRLSGGQKQRIAIARALLADPLILILDEATSNLDTESEVLIQRSLATLMKGRTSFVIAHRLSTVRHASRIVVIEQGRITETGTHDDLTAHAGRYAELLKLQIEGTVRTR